MHSFSFCSYWFMRAFSNVCRRLASIEANLSAVLSYLGSTFFDFGPLLRSCLEVGVIWDESRSRIGFLRLDFEALPEELILNFSSLDFCPPLRLTLVILCLFGCRSLIISSFSNFFEPLSSDFINF